MYIIYILKLNQIILIFIYTMDKRTLNTEDFEMEEQKDSWINFNKQVLKALRENNREDFFQYINTIFKFLRNWDWKFKGTEIPDELVYRVDTHLIVRLYKQCKEFWLDTEMYFFRYIYIRQIYANYKKMLNDNDADQLKALKSNLKRYINYIEIDFGLIVRLQEEDYLDLLLGRK